MLTRTRLELKKKLRSALQDAHHCWNLMTNNTVISSVTDRLTSKVKKMPRYAIDHGDDD